MSANEGGKVLRPICVLFSSFLLWDRWWEQTKYIPNILILFKNSWLFCQLFLCCLPPNCCYSSHCLYIFAWRCSQLWFHFKCASDFLRTKKLFNAQESQFLCKMAKKQEEKLQVFSTFRFRLYDISREIFWMFFHFTLPLLRRVISFMRRDVSASTMREQKTLFQLSKHTAAVEWWWYKQERSFYMHGRLTCAVTAHNKAPTVETNSTKENQTRKFQLLTVIYTHFMFRFMKKRENIFHNKPHPVRGGVARLLCARADFSSLFFGALAKKLNLKALSFRAKKITRFNKLFLIILYYFPLASPSLRPVSFAFRLWVVNVNRRWRALRGRIVRKVMHNCMFTFLTAMWSEKSWKAFFELCWWCREKMSSMKNIIYIDSFSWTKRVGKDRPHKNLKLNTEMCVYSRECFSRTLEKVLSLWIRVFMTLADSQNKHTTALHNIK